MLFLKKIDKHERQLGKRVADIQKQIDKLAAELATCQEELTEIEITRKRLTQYLPGAENKAGKPVKRGARKVTSRKLGAAKRKIFEVLDTKADFLTVPEIAQLTKLKPPQLYTNINDAVKRGELEAFGKGRGNKYKLTRRGKSRLKAK